MIPEYQVDLWEDDIERDHEGRIVHHPLNSRYGEDHASYGYLTFAGHDLDKSSLLDDVRVFYLEFSGESSPTSSRKAWADPLRVDVLKRLTSENRRWYLSIIRDTPIIVDSQTNFSGNERLKYAIVQSEKHYGYGYGFIPRLFAEVPNQLISTVANYYWSEAVPGWPIEGYNMEPDQISILEEWDKKPRDVTLFRAVIDKVFVAFYTFPAENRHFVFVTNKLSLDDLKQILDLDALQQKANIIGQQGGG